MKVVAPQLALILLFILCCACDGESQGDAGVLPDKPTISLHEVASVQKVEDQQISGIRSLLLAESGDVLLYDWSMQSIKRFDRDGNFIEHIGRNGGAEGGLMNIHSMVMAPGDTLHVYDFSNSRHRVLAEVEGQWIQLREMNRHKDPEAQLGAVFPSEVIEVDGQLYGRFRSQAAPRDTTAMFHEWFTRVDYNLNPLNSEKLLQQPAQDAVFIQNGRSAKAQPVQAGYRLFTQFEAGTNTFHSIRNDDAVIHRVNLHGEEQHPLKLPREHIITEDSEIRSYEAQMLEYFARETARDAAAKVLPHQPYVSSFILDDSNRYWVEMSRSDPASPNWIVFDQDGTQLGSLHLEKNVAAGSLTYVLAVRGDRIYTFRSQDYSQGLVIYDAVFE